LDVGEEAGRRRMADADGLVGFAFAAGGRAQHLDRGRIPQRFQVAPESSRDAAIVRVLHHTAQRAVLDDPRALAAELKLVAAVVDGPRDVRFHDDAVFDLADEVFHRRTAGFDVQIRHTVYGGTIPVAGPRIGDAAGIGARLA